MGAVNYFTSDYNGTIQAIKAVIKEMRSELKTIPTWLQHERNDRRFI